MYVIKMKDILNDVEAVRFVVTGIDRPVEAWRIAENLARSYFEHGLDRTEKAYWFKDQSGLHYIWAERQRPVEQEDVPNDPERVASSRSYRPTDGLARS